MAYGSNHSFISVKRKNRIKQLSIKKKKGKIGFQTVNPNLTLMSNIEEIQIQGII